MLKAGLPQPVFCDLPDIFCPRVRGAVSDPVALALPRRGTVKFIWPQPTAHAARVIGCILCSPTASLHNRSAPVSETVLMAARKHFPARQPSCLGEFARQTVGKMLNQSALEHLRL